MKDLDLNQDGVIDFDEFCRWYFTGMKSYTGTKRTMLRISKGSTSIFNALSSKAKEAFGGELKTKTHKFSVSFNAPKKVGAHLETAFYLCGARYNAARAELNQYAGTFDLDKYR